MATETIHLAQVTDWSRPPSYTTRPYPPPPSSGETQIHVKAAGVHRVVRSRAAGTHYSARGLPHLPGSDGTGVTSEGKAVYFSSLTPSGGSMAEVVNVANAMVFPLPEGADLLQVAAGVNPGMSSWMALTQRCEGLEPGFSVFVMGVTSASGKVAVSLARHLGAGKIIGLARNEKAMQDMGLDEVIVLKERVEETEWEKAGKVDVVLDYLYGVPTELFMKSLKPGKKIQYVQVGSLAGETFAFPSAVLRSNDIVLRGSGPGAWSMAALSKELPELLKALTGIEKQKVRVEKLADIERVWVEPAGSERLVFVP